MSIPAWLNASGPFTSAVRNGAITGPVRPRFSSERWTDAIGNPALACIGDLQLWASGLWFDVKLTRLRTYVETLPHPPIRPGDRIRLLVGLANHQQLLMYGALEERVAKAMAGAPWQRFADSHATDIDVEDLVASMIDGLRYALSSAWRQDQGLTRSAFDQGKALSDLYGRALAGFQYDLLESLWASCVWRGWFVDLSYGVGVVRPRDREFELRCAVGRYRAEKLRSEFSTNSLTEWGRLPVLMRAATAAQPRVTSLRSEGRHRAVVWGVGNPSLGPQSIEITQLEVFDPYLTPLLHNKSLASLCGLSVARLLDVWRFLAPLGELLCPSAPRSAGINSFQAARDYAHTIEISELVRAVSTALGITPEQARTALALLTFDGDPRHDLWSRPLIRVDEARVAVLKTVIESASLERLAGTWLRNGGAVMDSRGPLWEQHLRGDLRDSAAYLPNAAVHPAALSGLPGNVGDIDILVRVGSTVIVLELKCSLTPVSPLEEFNYFAVLRHGALQARSKADWVRSHRTTVQAMTGWQLDPATLRAFPCVATNTAVGAGHIFENVPVVDRYILTRYFHPGYYERGVRIGVGTPRQVEETVHFYNSPSMAEANITQYLMSPPQLADIHKYAASRCDIILSTDSQDMPGAFEKATVDHPVTVVGA